MCVRSTPRGNSEGRSKSREQCPAVDQRGRWRCLYSLLPIGRALLHSWKGADENALRILLSQYHVRKWCRSPLLKCRRSLSLPADSHFLMMVVRRERVSLQEGRSFSNIELTGRSNREQLWKDTGA